MDLETNEFIITHIYLYKLMKNIQKFLCKEQ